MSTLSEEARSKAKDKAERLVRADPTQRVDASGYRPEGAMDADVQTGLRPISRRQFRRGGKVAGETSAPRADRKPRATGGRTLTADSLINRDVKAANEERDGTKHVGGFKKGGRPGKLMGGPTGSIANQVGGAGAAPTAPAGSMMGQALAARGAPAGGAPMMRPMQRATGGPTTNADGKDLLNRAKYNKSGNLAAGELGRMRQQLRTGAAGTMAAPATETPVPTRPATLKSGGKVHTKGCDCARCGGGRVGKKAGGAINDGTRPTGGRLARKGGGRTKKGTNVNIIITQPDGMAKPPMPMGPPMVPPGAPPGLHQGIAPPPGAMPPGAMPPPGMPRAAGGRTLEKDGGKLAKPGRYPIDSGAGGGLGRLEKAERAARS